MSKSLIFDHFLFFAQIKSNSFDSICANHAFPFNPVSFSGSSFLPPEVDQPRLRAQALSDRDAESKDELSLMAYEVSVQFTSRDNVGKYIYDLIQMKDPSLGRLIVRIAFLP